MTARVEIISLGGTIAMTQQATGEGVQPTLSADDLVAAVPSLNAVARIGARNLANVPSTEIDLPLLFELSDMIKRFASEGVAGIVVTQGTDTIEETSFVLDLLLALDIPVVVTGAMRHPAMAGADGPANLLAAVQCAVSPDCRGLGILVVMNDDIHAARYVQKRHSSSAMAFWSAAPLGHVSEGTPVIRSRLPRRPAFPPVLPDTPVPFVPILKPGLGDDGRMVRLARDAGAAGLVMDLAGGGHSAAALAGMLEEAARMMPVVFDSRTGGGRVLSRTYGQLGGEIDLARRGLIGAGDLDSLKARLLLILLIMAGVPQWFGEFSDLSVSASSHELTLKEKYR